MHGNRGCQRQKWYESLKSNRESSDTYIEYEYTIHAKRNVTRLNKKKYRIKSNKQVQPK